MTLVDVTKELLKRCRDMQIGEIRTFTVEPPASRMHIHMMMNVAAAPEHEFDVTVEGSKIQVTRKAAEVQDYRFVE